MTFIEWLVTASDTNSTSDDDDSDVGGVNGVISGFASVFRSDKIGRK